MGTTNKDKIKSTLYNGREWSVDKYLVWIDDVLVEHQMSFSKSANTFTVEKLCNLEEIKEYQKKIAHTFKIEIKEGDTFDVIFSDPTYYLCSVDFISPLNEWDRLKLVFSNEI